MRTAVASGFRRSLTRTGGRTITALIALAVVGQLGWAPSRATSGIDRADGATQIELAAPQLAVTDATDVPATTDAGGPAAELAGYATTAPAGTAPADGDADADAAVADNAGLEPSIQFEEAEKHADDKIAFEPGARVTIGFKPRASDPWTVGGVRPTALPAGRLDGIAMRRQHGPAAQAPQGPDAVDVPTETGPAPDGVQTSVSEPDLAADLEPASDATVSAAGLRREIFGFLPYWQVNSSTLRLDYSKISTIAYFGVGADGAGNLQKRNADGTTTVGWSGWTSSKMTSIISAAHTNKTRVVLTVQSFAWNTSGQTRQKALLGSSTARLNLARQIAAAVRDRGADGVNLDFEPLASTFDDEFTALVRTVRAELNKIHSGYQITFDTTGSIGNYPIEEATAPGGADAIFIMGYDYRGSTSSPVGSIAPLRRTGYDIADTVAAYAARVPASKLILGVPYYGRAWSTSSSAVHATNTSSSKTGASTTVIYSTAAGYLTQYGRKYEATEQVAWTAYQRQNCTATYGCVTSWRQLYVDDATSLGVKYDLVNSYGLRGAGIWALGYDGTRPELWSTIQRKFIGDSSAPIAGVRTLANRQLNPAFTVAWTGRDDAAVASYDVQVSTDSGPWTAWLNATTAASAVWSGADNRSYAFRVRARDARANVSAWNVTATNATATSLAVGGFGLVGTDGLSKRTGPDTAATKVGEFSTGNLVSIVGGPTTADGHTWYQVKGPLSEWTAVTSPGAAVWVARGTVSDPWLTPAKAPNATRVTAAIGDLGYASAGAASLGSAAAAVRSFSPNGDGAADRMAIHWTNDRALDTLALKIFRSNGSLAGTVPVGQLAAGSRSFTWDGKVSGASLPDGRYLATLVGTAGGSTFFNPTAGFSVAAFATHGLTIDTAAPAVTAASVAGSTFSPNGDGLLETIRVSLSTTGATRWAFSAAPVSGTTIGAPIRTLSGATGSTAVAWDGKANGGASAPDGTYRLTLAASDDAGNRVSRGWNVRLDRLAPAITPTAPARFSPNGDGVSDTARLAWSSTERITGTARIFRGSTIIRSWTVSNALSGATTWTGTDAAGRAVPDGTYSYRVSGRDAASNVTTRSVAVVVDRTLGTVRWSPGAFYPQDGDKISASSRVSFTLKRSAVVTLTITSGSTVVRTAWTKRTMAAGTYSWVWNGRNAAGGIVARGTYRAVVTATSSLGTSVVTRSVLADAFRVVPSATAVRAGQVLTITLTTTEALLARPSVSLTQPGRAAVTRTATSLGSGVYRVSFTIAAGAAGTATIRVTGRDSANGLNSSTATVTIR